jgi:hypothetical protein
LGKDRRRVGAAARLCGGVGMAEGMRTQPKPGGQSGVARLRSLNAAMMRRAVALCVRGSMRLPRTEPPKLVGVRGSGQRVPCFLAAGPRPSRLRMHTRAACCAPAPLLPAAPGQVCGALAALEACAPPVLHRDVKPSNVFIDGAGRARLGDFGLARLRPASAATLTGETGTYLYMAPEMIRWGGGSGDHG